MTQHKLYEHISTSTGVWGLQISWPGTRQTTSGAGFSSRSASVDDGSFVVFFGVCGPVWREWWRRWWWWWWWWRREPSSSPWDSPCARWTRFRPSWLRYSGGGVSTMEPWTDARRWRRPPGSVYGGGSVGLGGARSGLTCFMASSYVGGGRSHRPEKVVPRKEKKRADDLEKQFSLFLKITKAKWHKVLLSNWVLEKNIGLPN